jgi:hypothetical protein
MNKVQGTIKDISQTESRGDFRFRKLTLTTNDKYPQVLSIDFTQDNCVLLDSYQLGQSVEVAYNLRGREWTNPQGETKVFNSIQGWKINEATEEVTAADQAPDREGLPF